MFSDTLTEKALTSMQVNILGVCVAPLERCNKFDVTVGSVQ